jgi:hypothetical protein
MTAVAAPAGSDFNAVSCTSPTSCTAVGQEGGGLGAPIYATETHGAWATAKAIAVPGGIGTLNAVSCASALDCTAVGASRTAKSANVQPIYVTETNGVWGKVKEIASPLGGGSFSGVSCTSATHCTAVGTDGQGFPIYPTELAGVWPSVPGAPRSLRVTSANRSVGVTWATAAIDGGARVTSYTARAVVGAHSYSCTTAERSCVIHGLANGTTYVVSVVARNPAGSSKRTAAVTATAHA